MRDVFPVETWIELLKRFVRYTESGSVEWSELEGNRGDYVANTDQKLWMNVWSKDRDDAGPYCAAVGRYGQEDAIDTTESFITPRTAEQAVHDELLIQLFALAKGDSAGVQRLTREVFDILDEFDKGSQNAPF